MDIYLTIALVGLLVFMAHLFAGAYARTQIPDVVFLIAIGLILGPVMGWVRPIAFGKVGPVFTTLTLVIILFEGGLDLHLETLQRTYRRTIALTVIGFFATMSLVGAGVLVLTDLPPLTAFTLGAIIGSTSPAVVVPLTRVLGLHRETRSMLSLESALSDVLSIVVTFALLELHDNGDLHPGQLTGQMLASFSFAALIGGGAALGWSVLLRRLRGIKNSMFTTPAFVFVIFGFVELLHFSGFIAALAFGIILGNIKLIKGSAVKRFLPLETFCLNESETVFFAEIVFLLKTFFFVYMGLSFRFTDTSLILVALALSGLIFLARLPVARLTVGNRMSRYDATVVAAMAPKGLAAAALAAVPLQRGIAGGEQIQDIAYSVVLLSVLGTSALLFLLSRTPLSQVVGRLFWSLPVTRPPDEDGDADAPVDAASSVWGHVVSGEVPSGPVATDGDEPGEPPAR